MIVIIGPDGSGKTTIANELILKLKADNINATHSTMHFEILPPLKNFINPFLKNKIDSSHEEGALHVGMKKPNSVIKGLVYVIWYAFDYFLGSFKVLKTKQKKEVIIFARYYYDYYYQLGHLNTPKWIIKIFENLVPKPNFIFTISRSAKAIYKLKPELTVKEIERQQIEIEKIFYKRNNAFIINGDKGIEDTTKQILEIIGDSYA
jgi:thymidylate kinase